MAPASGLERGTLCQAVNRGGAAPAGSRGRCDENSPHCYGGRQGEKAHKGATNFARGRGDEFRQRMVRPSLGGQSDEDRQALGHLASVVKAIGRCVLVHVRARNGTDNELPRTLGSCLSTDWGLGMNSEPAMFSGQRRVPSECIPLSMRSARRMRTDFWLRIWISFASILLLMAALVILAHRIGAHRSP